LGDLEKCAGLWLVLFQKGKLGAFLFLFYDTSMEKDILLIDKPAGISSFDVIRILRRNTGIRKMGHSGTLDPFATGLLLVGVESGTKKLTTLTKLPKEYVATFLLGVQTDTGDRTGKILVREDASRISEEEVRASLEALLGERSYYVPAYSAIKIDGKKLYELARAGKEIDLPLKKMEVFSAELLSYTKEKDTIYLEVKFFVSSGTYIRTLGEELAKLLGTVGTTTELRRTRVGEFSVTDAEPLDMSKWEIKNTRP